MSLDNDQPKTSYKEVCEELKRLIDSDKDFVMFIQSSKKEGVKIQSKNISETKAKLLRKGGILL